MREYVIEREMPDIGSLTEEKIREVSLQSLAVLRSLGGEVQWLHSYVTDHKMFCVYMATNESVIQEHARLLGVPANRISAVRRMIDPAKYS